MKRPALPGLAEILIWACTVVQYAFLANDPWPPLPVLIASRFRGQRLTAPVMGGAVLGFAVSVCALPILSPFIATARHGGARDAKT